MKIIKLSDSTELSVSDTTYAADSLAFEAMSLSGTTEIVEKMSDSALSHIELYAGGSMLDSRDNLSVASVTLEKANNGYRMLVVLTNKESAMADK